MSYIQKLIDSQDNIIIICDKYFNIKRINKIYYNFFHTDRVNEIVKIVKQYRLDEEHKLKIRNYRDEKYTFLIKLTKVDDDIIINMTNITKVSAYKKSLLQSNFNFLEYQNLINKFLIVSKTDLNGIITYVNDNFIEVYGYSKEELIGKPHNIIRHPDMPSYVFKNMWKIITKGKMWQGVVKNKKKNGEVYYVKTLISPLFNSKGKINEYLAVRVDITELIKAKEKAQMEKKAKEMFLANMSHEIRTPLTGIMGFIDILKHKDLPEDITHIVDIIDNSADTLLNVVNDILELSKIETEGVTIHLNEFDAKSSFENTIELFKAKAKEKNLEYSYNIDIDSCIISDEHRLKQVLSNLIGNAIKFTPENGKVKVDIKSVKKNGKVKVDFSVSDTGIGIPKSKQDKLFKPFSQIDSQEKFGGTGLGLYISYQIVEKLGGKLAVESEHAKGTKFYFSLEFKECKKIETEVIDKICVEGKLLIAEDDKVIQELLRNKFQTKGNLELTIVNNGKEALELFKTDKFDMIFLDSSMPIMRGEEAVRQILEYEKENNLIHTPLIALTANALNGDREKYLSNGFDNYVLKPIDDKELDKVLLKYLKNCPIKKTDDVFSGLDEDMKNELIMLYFEYIYTDLDRLKKAIEDKNFNSIKEAAHKIAGASFAVGFDDIAKIAKEIENHARNEKNIEYLELFDKIYYTVEQQNTLHKGN